MQSKRAAPLSYAGETKVAARRHAWFIASTMATAADKSGLNFWIATTSGISCRNTLPAITATESNFSPLGKNCLIDPQWDGLRLAVRFSVQGVGAAEWIRTTTLLRAPAPQAGASASSATSAKRACSESLLRCWRWLCRCRASRHRRAWCDWLRRCRNPGGRAERSRRRRAAHE